ncbi:DUF1415 domain-containing protein [Ramlibacter rhizophilus]|uniref:DUF1415 domain-containing protein n=1 Tax=Ramlibacter rhizophilus TaxID=1781167 RepID=A0A4Z0BMH3_9BURK|nr:DUF1415 domain-containing protein [Ramlibacter rhizophilus]TFY99609.1 DUF1415 domain-containing protein [Ramlibacter rhizophilus]
MIADPALALEPTRLWLERAVIGLNLCPFAKAVLAKGQVHFALTPAQDWGGVCEALVREAAELLARDPAERDTTLLVAPHAPADFVEFAGLVAQGERLLANNGWSGILQLASFHPAFQFAGVDPEDITNSTNRSPWPTLHLLREASIERAVRAFPDAADIYEANMATLRRLGPDGWAQVLAGTP